MAGPELRVSPVFYALPFSSRSRRARGVQAAVPRRADRGETATASSHFLHFHSLLVRSHFPFAAAPPPLPLSIAPTHHAHTTRPIHPFLIHLIPPPATHLRPRDALEPHRRLIRRPPDPARPLPTPKPLFLPSSLPPQTKARPGPASQPKPPALPPSPLPPQAPRRDGRAPPRLLHPPPGRRRGLPLLRRVAPARLRLLRSRGAGAPLAPPGPTPPPPRGPRQAPRRRRRRGGELRVRAGRGGRRERDPPADGVRPREAGEDLRRRGRRRVLRQPHRAARGEDRAHRRDRQVVQAAAARRQLPQRRRRQLPRRDRAADRRRVRERLQRPHGHRGRHRHLRRAARVSGPRADRAARPEDDRRPERPPQDEARPGAHRRVHCAVRPRWLQPHRHERPEADRGDRVRVRAACRHPRCLIGLRRQSSPLKPSRYYLEELQESSGNVGLLLQTCRSMVVAQIRMEGHSFCISFPFSSGGSLCNSFSFFVVDNVICLKHSIIAEFAPPLSDSLIELRVFV